MGAVIKRITLTHKSTVTVRLLRFDLEVNKPECVLDDDLLVVLAVTMRYIRTM